MLIGNICTVDYLIGKSLNELLTDHTKWSQKTFSDDTVRGPLGPLKHLVKEASEAIEAWCEYLRNLAATDVDSIKLKEEEFHVELADCLLLIMDATRRAGLTFAQLIEVAKAKMVVNKSREWNVTSPIEPAEHKRS